MQDAIQSERDAAAQAGQTVLVYIRKGIGRPFDVGSLARYAAKFACRAMYWESEQARRDSIEHTVLTQERFSKTPTPEEAYEWREFDREYFNRKQWEWFNGTR